MHSKIYWTGVTRARCKEKFAACLGYEKKVDTAITFNITSDKGTCVAASMKDQLSAKTMPCATKNYLACHGIGLVLDNVVDGRNVCKIYFVVT